MGVIDGARIEGGRHQRVVVVLGCVFGLLAVLPGAPDGAHHADVALDALGRRGPGAAEAAQVVALHLGAEADVDAAFAELLQVPGGLRHDEGGTRKGDGDAGRQLQALRVLSGKRQREHGVVLQLASGDAVEAVGFGALYLVLDVAQPCLAVARGHLHQLSPSLGRRRYRSGPREMMANQTLFDQRYQSFQVEVQITVPVEFRITVRVGAPRGTRPRAEPRRQAARRRRHHAGGAGSRGCR